MNDLYNLLYMRSYGVKQKKVTECVPGSERYENSKNGRLILKCKCSECGQICETDGKRVSPSSGAGILATVASTGADLLIHHGIPWFGKKAVEMGRYYGSEPLRHPKMQEKAIDYALDKLNPMIQNVGSQALDQLSTKIRPKKKYKTNIKELDGAGVLDTITSTINAGQKFAELVAPSTKPVFKRYWSGDLIKGAFNTRDGFFSKDFWEKN